jgi:hypothetical protein
VISNHNTILVVACLRQHIRSPSFISRNRLHKSLNDKITGVYASGGKPSAKAYTKIHEHIYPDFLLAVTQLP